MQTPDANGIPAAINTAPNSRLSETVTWPGPTGTGAGWLAGLLHFLVISNLTGRLVNEEVYYAAIDSVDLYNRIYDEVLVDNALASQTDNLLGGVQVDVHGQAVSVLREILPPAYLREQTEENIERFTSYMNGEAEQLEIYLELDEPPERVLPTVQDHVSQVLDTLDTSEAVESLCTSEDVRLLAADTAPLLQRLSGGRLPESAPELLPGDRDCSEQVFDQWLDDVVSDPALDTRTSGLLAENQQELRLPFVEGDTRALLQAAVEPLIGPLARERWRTSKANCSPARSNCVGCPVSARRGLGRRARPVGPGAIPEVFRGVDAGGGGPV